MAFGNLRCVHCHDRLPIRNNYPWVGRVLKCMKRQGLMVVDGHYLEYNGAVTFAIRKLTPWETERVRKAIEHETT